jgi:hypothetical protein
VKSGDCLGLFDCKSQSHCLYRLAGVLRLNHLGCALYEIARQAFKQRFAV